jgi:hypothetical protein
MSRFIISKKLTLQEALDFIPQIEKWFKDNPKRKFCQTETFRVRRGFTATDVFEHTDLSTMGLS